MKNYKFTITASDKTKAAFKSVKNGLKGIRAGVNSTQLQIGVMAGALGLGALIKSSLDYADELGKMSDRLNIATEDLAAFHNLTQLNGESTESFDRAIEKMVRGLGEAERGFGPTLKGLEELNINLKDVKGKTAGEQFIIISDGIKGLETQTQKASVAADIFGRKGIRLLTTLNQGRAGFEASRKEVDEYGLSLSRIDAAKAEAANDAILRSQQAIKGVGIRISTQLAPFITAATKAFTKMTLNATKGSGWIIEGIDGVSAVIGTMADGLHGVEIIFQGAKIAGIGFGTAVLGAIKLLIDGVGFLFNGMKDLVLGPIGALIEAGNALGVISDEAIQAFNDIDEGLTFETPEMITTAFSDMVTVLGEENSKLGAMMMEPLPSTGITQTFESIKMGAIEVGKKIEEEISGKLNTGLSEDDEAKLQAKLDRIGQSLLTELELIQQKETAELDILRQAQEGKLLNYQEYLQKKYQTEQKFDKQRGKLKKSAVASEGKTLNDLSSLSKNFGEKGEKLSKAIALRETITNTHSGAMAAYQALAGIPIVGPALGAIAYGTVWAQGIKAQSGIKSGSKSGGGASVSVPSIQKTASRDPVDLGIDKQGKDSSQSAVINNTYVFNNPRGNDGQILVEEAAKAIDEGAVLINPGTRQAQELLEGF